MFINDLVMWRQYNAILENSNITKRSWQCSGISDNWNLLGAHVIWNMLVLKIKGKVNKIAIILHNKIPTPHGIYLKLIQKTDRISSCITVLDHCIKAYIVIVKHKKKKQFILSRTCLPYTNIAYFKYTKLMILLYIFSSYKPWKLNKLYLHVYLEIILLKLDQIPHPYDN